MRRRLCAYLAGPDVFLPDAAAVGRHKKRLCTDYGFDGLYPLDDNPPDQSGAAGPSGARIDTLIYRTCVTMLRRADFAIVDLTPFRGPSADSGTVFELGMLIGLGKPVFGYTNETRDLLDRIGHAGVALFDRATHVWRDAAGMVIENFGNADNLMIDRALADQGHELVRHSAPEAAYYRDLTGFEACLRLAAAALDQGGGAADPGGSAR